MNLPRKLLIFALDRQLHAVGLEAVERVIRAVAITPLPEAPPAVSGIINVQGEIVPVFDLRRRFGQAGRAVRVRDQMVLVRTAHRRVALVANEVRGVVECSEDELAGPERIAPGLALVKGVLRMDEELAVIYDPENFLTSDELLALDQAINGMGDES
ncbi:MAG TPA: chemotaxis protein CheW [Blastocatellia bacterium]|nr:chemotaxis protein CheW [Blastocatellia bacterium]